MPAQMEFEAQFGFRMLIDRKTGGEMDFDPRRINSVPTIYGGVLPPTGMNCFGKIGYVFPEKNSKRYRSAGFGFQS